MQISRSVICSSIISSESRGGDVGSGESCDAGQIDGSLAPVRKDHVTSSRRRLPALGQAEADQS